MPYPELSLELLPPGRMSAPEVVGGTIEGGRTLNGFGPVADISGGGYVTIKYGAINIDSNDPARYRYYQQLAAMLAGGRRSILVPLLTDFTAPLLAGDNLLGHIPYSDGALHSDGSGFNQNPIVAAMGANAALNAGTLSISVERGAPLYGGEWFEIAHPNKSSRAYTITDIDSSSSVGTTITYIVGIRPTLREAVSITDFVNFRRPRCLMRVQGRMQLEVTPPWQARPEITFIEAFP